MKKWSVPRTKEMKILGNKRDRQWTRYMETGDNNHYKSYKTRFRKNYFSLRITNIWNNLPKHVVEAVSVNRFKNLVDGHFRNTGYYYDYKYKPEVEL